VKVLAANLSTGKGAPGEILGASKDGLVVACGEQALCLTRLQLPGGKALNFSDLFNSRREKFAAARCWANEPTSGRRPCLAAVLSGKASLNSSLPAQLDKVEDRDRGLTQDLAFGTARWQPRLSAGRTTAAEAVQGRRRRCAGAAAGRPLPAALHPRAGPRRHRRNRRLRRQAEKAVGQGPAQRRAAPRPARRRGAAGRHGARPGGAHRPPALAAKIPESLLAGAMGSHLRGQQRPPADDPAGQPPPSQPRCLPGLLAEAGIAASACQYSRDGIVLAEACDVRSLPGFAEGWISVQDEAAQLAADLLDLAPGQRVLDACCAPGGKTCHILEAEAGLATWWPSTWKPSAWCACAKTSTAWADAELIAATPATPPAGGTASRSSASCSTRRARPPA
jgi:16S rRNA (cytosine967-C5)-methyltransferase